MDRRSMPFDQEGPGFLRPKPDGGCRATRSSARLAKRTPNVLPSVQATVAWCLLPENVSSSSKVFGTKPLPEMVNNAPVREKLAIRHGTRLAPATIVAGRLAGCRGSLRAMALPNKAESYAKLGE
jgi:hypothetical protein